MRLKISGIWLMWLLAMVVLAGVMWVLFMFPLPGFSSSIPAAEEVLELFAHVGVGGTLTLLAAVFLPAAAAPTVERRTLPNHFDVRHHP
jgi:hypothetical protein